MSQQVPKWFRPANHANHTNEEAPIRVIRVIRWHFSALHTFSTNSVVEGRWRLGPKRHFRQFR